MVSNLINNKIIAIALPPNPGEERSSTTNPPIEMINVHVTRCRLQKVSTQCVNLTALERCIHNWECCTVENMREFKLHIILAANYWNCSHGKHMFAEGE